MSNDFLAVSAGVLLVVAGGNAERNQAAAEPAADEAENEAKDPAECALLLRHLRHAGLAAVLALHCYGMVGPVVDGVRASATRHLGDDHSLGLLVDHGLSWHGLSWHGLSSHWLTWHGLSSHWLTWHGLCNKRLLFRCDSSFILHCCSSVSLDISF